MTKRKRKKKVRPFKPTLLFYFRGKAFACISTRSHKYSVNGFEFGGKPVFDQGKGIKDLLKPKQMAMKILVDDGYYLDCKKVSVKQSVVTGPIHRPYVRMKLQFVKSPQLLTFA